jgi:mortality factor 4-like protein 1
VRKLTEENKELAAQLHAEMKNLQQKGLKDAKKTTASGIKGKGSDFGTPRGSEERHASAAGRGPRRGRDYEVEQVSLPLFYFCLTFRIVFVCSLDSRPC